MALLTTVVLLFAAEGDSLASWHLRCCHGNSRGARRPLLLRQRAELQSQALSSPPPPATALRCPPQPGQPGLARPPSPWAWPSCHLPQAQAHSPFLGETACACRPPGRAPGPQALLGQTPHLPNGDSQTRAQSWAEQGGGRCCNRPGGAEETDVARAWASPLLRTPCRLSCDPSPGEGAPRAQVSWEPESAPPEGGSRGDSGS